ncbi:LysR family transcriptional regulator [Heyndrickxia sporothermodurans]|uniref:LysR family transcriptional regulator n=1 Tax=Heyndrickxia TaxID=2837504 RepID=UPI000D347707|nr:LysR family transcriptional regulator [Heyndrickxia sporothermodurans]PTY77646.1 LysR family transcriptional regulator [Heyndrickxia sporothermodurans]
MDDRDWLILQTLYHEKNITKAAKELYISQPALTNRLQQIEKEFGVQIVNRGRRGVQFTPQGEYLAKSAYEILISIRKIKENVRNMENYVTGTLRIGVTNFFAYHKLPELLKLFKDQYPNIEFKISTGFSGDIANLVSNEDIHIGFVRGDYGWKEKKHLLFEEKICIVSKEKIDIERLPQLPRIDYRTDHLLKTLVDHWWGENYSKPPLISIEVDKAETCKEMVINGLGYAILPSMILDDIDGLYKSEIRTKNNEAILRKTWMFYHEESLKLSMVKAFVTFIENIDFYSINKRK